MGAYGDGLGLGSKERSNNFVPRSQLTRFGFSVSSFVVESISLAVASGYWIANANPLRMKL